MPSSKRSNNIVDEDDDDHINCPWFLGGGDVFRLVIRERRFQRNINLEGMGVNWLVFRFGYNIIQTKSCES